MMSSRKKFSPDVETVRLLSAAAVEAIMENRATAIGRMGEFAVAALCRDVHDNIHAVARVEVIGMAVLEVGELRDHRRRPKGAEMIGDLGDCLLVGEARAIGRDLLGHPGESLDAHG